jgi:TPR repeat protein
MKKIFLAALLANYITNSFAEYSEGLSAYKANNFAVAFKEFSSSAKQGDARSRFAIGMMYHNGQGVPKDYTQAASWYRKAAEQGHAASQYSLGLMYSKGEGIQQDSEQAVGWYRKAAEQGNARAQSNLGFMYFIGQGVPKDYAQAAGWYHKAAEQGYAIAQNNLGMMYDNGQGVPQNRVVAYALFNLAAVDMTSNGSVSRAVALSKMTPMQVEAGQLLSSEMAKPNNLNKAIAAYLNQ